MKTNDKVLVGIVAGILTLIIAALVITLIKPEPTYMADDTPQGAAQNYLLALLLKDYEKAYSYLSPTVTDYPRTLDIFIKNIKGIRIDESSSFSLESVTTTGLNSTVTMLRTRFNADDLFSSGQSTYMFEMYMEKINGSWKLIDSDSFFPSCWQSKFGCP